MKTKTLFATLAATVAVAAIAGPAAAQQPYGYDRGDQGRYEQGRYEQGGYDQGRYDQGGYNQGRYDQGRYEQRRDNDGRWNENRGGYNLDRQLAQLRERIAIGTRRGTLSPREAAALRNEWADLSSDKIHMAADGLTYRERAQLDRRLNRLDVQITRESRDRDREYGEGYGYRR